MFILAITPGTGFEAARWKAVLGSGIDGLMIREKQLEAGPLLDLARRVHDLAPHLELWVNGRLDVALAAGCGLHAPEAYPDIPSGLLPLSRPIHSGDQLGSRMDCRQLLLGPVFPVPEKGLPWGIKRLHQTLDEIPPGPRILALGGITPTNSAPLRHPRLDGIALIRALMKSPEPDRVVDAFRQAWA
ncbi:MAG: thiamine phosphate synthase [Acidobacteriota bacterium]|nr:thiamine phosphate synthase [Acidobacteriota bacterium]